MAISFPSNPSNGDKFESNSMLYQYDGTNSLWIRLNRKDVSHYTDTTNLLPAQTLQVVNVPDLASLPGSASAGQMMYVLSENKLYLWTGSTWQTMTLAKQNPVLTSTTDGSGGTSPFTLATDGSTTVITMTASHPDSLPLIYNYNVVAGSLTNGGGTTATITQGTGAQSNQFFIQPSTDAAYNGSFTLEFTVSDGEATEVSVGEFELAISTAIDIRGLTDDAIKFNFAPQHTLPRSIEIKPDGTKLYMTGSSSGGTPGVYQYTLSSPYDLSSMAYDNTLLDLTAIGNTPITFDFKPDGTKLWVIETSTIYQFSLSTSWDIGTATLDASYSGTLVGSTIYGMAFDDAGTKLIVQSGDFLREYVMSNPYDLTDLTYNNVIYQLPVAVGECRDIEFTTDGKGLVLTDRSNDKIWQFELGTSYDITTISNQIRSYTVSVLAGTTNIQPTGLALGNDNTKLYMLNQGNDQVYQFTIGDYDGWEITDISADVTGYDNKLLYVGAEEASPHGIHFSNDGSQFFVIGSTADDLVQYTCSTPWDISTATHTYTVDVNATNKWGSAGNNPYGFDWKPDGTKVYICGVGGNWLLEGSLSTPWDISTLTATTASNVDLGTLISGSSFPAGLVFKPDGTKAWLQNNLGVNEINFSVPWDISSATFSNVNAGLGNWGQMHFNSDGTQVFVRITTGIRQFAVPTPYSLASVNTSSFIDWDPIPVSSGNSQTRGFCFHDGNGGKVYNITSVDNIEQHSVTSF